MPLQLPDGIDTRTFLRDYWQRRPLLMPAALTPPPRLTAGELAGLACEAGVESRIIHGNRTQGWRLRHGPFDDADFAALPARDWTLLVQDVDKWLPAFAALIDSFRFLPDWRIDDAMISLAADGGSVGPHVDSYDVFLLQIDGEREWHIDEHIQPDPPLRDDCEPRIMRDFEATRSYRLHAGDLLYLPPHAPHWGIARGDGCMTCSIGFRAPDGDELLAAMGTWLSEHPRAPDHYRDPPLADTTHPAELDDAVFQRLRHLLEQATALADDEMRALFARLLSEPKPGFEPFPPDEPLNHAAFVERLRGAGTLYRHPGARLIYHRNDEQHITLWAGGESFTAQPGQTALLELLAAHVVLTSGQLEPWLRHSTDSRLLHKLYQAGIHAFEP